MRIIIISIAVALAAVVIGCEDDDRITGRPPGLDTLASVESPCEDEEAECIAVILSRQTLAPQWLYERVHADLAYIRLNFGDSIDDVQTTFSPDHWPGLFWFRMDTTVLDLSDSTTTGKFESICQVFGVKSWYYDFIKVQGYCQSERLYYPYELMKAFTEIDGIELLSNGFLLMDRPRLYALRTGSTMRYVFNLRWGDCPSGCMYGRFAYFISENGTCRHVESWTPDSTNWPDRPAWIDTIPLIECRMNAKAVWSKSGGWVQTPPICDQWPAHLLCSFSLNKLAGFG